MDRRTFVSRTLAAGAMAAGLTATAQAESNESVRILGVACSPRKGMTTAQSIQTALEAAKTVSERIHVAFVDLGGLKFAGQSADGTFEKDDFSEVILPLLTDPVPAGLIIGSPVYFRNLSSLCMAFLERLGAVRSPRLLLAHTTVGVLSVGAYRNGGQELVIAQIQAAMLCHHAKIVGGQPAAFQGATLWNNWGDDISKDTFGLESARKLGVRVAEEAQKGLSC
jgi:multimeric flavodoxin WrbA